MVKRNVRSHQRIVFGGNDIVKKGEVAKGKSMRKMRGLKDKHFLEGKSHKFKFFIHQCSECKYFNSEKSEMSLVLGGVYCMKAKKLMDENDPCPLGLNNPLTSVVEGEVAT